MHLHWSVEGTFKLPKKALKMGHLNVTATAIVKKGSLMCNGDGKNVVTVGDAVRRSIRVVAEGDETSRTFGGTFCTDGSKCPMPSELMNLC